MGDRDKATGYRKKEKKREREKLGMFQGYVMILGNFTDSVNK